VEKERVQGGHFFSFLSHEGLGRGDLFIFLRGGCACSSVEVIDDIVW